MWLPNSRERSFAQAAEFPREREREIVRAYRELPGETFPIPGRDPFPVVLLFLLFQTLEYHKMGPNIKRNLKALGEVKKCVPFVGGGLRPPP